MSFEPDWSGLDRTYPRDRALGFRQEWSDEDCMNGSIDTLVKGDKVWRPDPIGLRIEEGAIVRIEQVRIESDGGTYASKIGCYVQFTACFGSYGAYEQTYQWKFFSAEKAALMKLRGMADDAVMDGERKLAAIKATRDLIHAGEYDLRRYDAAGRIIFRADA